MNAPTEAVRTWFQGAWHEGNVPILGSADHGTWMGTMVFDGARLFEGRTPDLDLHCERLNRSAEALGMNPCKTAEEIRELVLDGLKGYPADAAVYIRPMYWSLEPGPGFITPDPDSTAFAICLSQVPMPPASATATLTTTRFHRPTLHVATTNAKASCLYPNNQRMLREALAKGFSNALVADAHGNVAETATSNVFMAKDGEVFTPIPNGTFLAGITRARHIALLRAAGRKVHETTLSFDDFRAADEVFMTGNLAKITPVVAFDEVRYEVGPVARQARELYWDWAHSGSA